MKRLLLLFFIAFFGVQIKVKAQPTLTAANTNVVIGEQFISNKFGGNAVPFNSGLATGANQTWNFSNLTSIFFPPIRIYFQTNHLPIGSQPFPASNAVIGCDDEYEYLKTSLDSVIQVGFYDNFREIIREYSNPVKVLQYPFTFNNSFTDNFSGQAWSMSPWYNFSGSINVVADGYGTLILPNGTVNNALRIKSIKVTISNIGIDSTTTLDWYLPGVHVPILKLSKLKYTSPNYNAIYYQGYYINPFALSVKEENAEQLNLQTFPNPATSEVTIQCSLKMQSQLRLILTDALGKEIMNVDQKMQAIGSYSRKLDVSNLPKGIYFVKLETAGNVAVKRLLIQ